MQNTLIVALCAAQAFAIKQSSTTYQTDAGQTATTYDWGMENLADVQAEIENWYEDTAKPYLSSHKQEVFDAALASIEQEKGALLATCDEGTACREKVWATADGKVKTEWDQVIKTFSK